MDKYKGFIQKDLLQLMKDEPAQAYILWQFKMDTDTAQAAYLPDDHLVTGMKGLLLIQLRTRKWQSLFETPKCIVHNKKISSTNKK